GLYTFSHSTKHVHLYQKYGYWPQFLTGVFAKQLQEQNSPDSGAAESLVCYSSLKGHDRDDCLKEADTITDSIYEGLSVSHEITILDKLNLGETVLVHDGSKLAGFAICHNQRGSEASDGTLYIKFAAVRPGARGARDFARLLRCCETLALRSDR